MSISDATLVIEHSSAYDPDYVQSKFDTIFGNGFVVDVIEEVITAGTKNFYLIVDQDHPALMRIIDLIHENTFAAIVYKKEWDRTTRKFVEVYWKVLINCPLFNPYLMNEAQLAELCLDVPAPCKLERSSNEPPPPAEEFASPTAMVRCDSDICITIDAPTAMVRSESDNVYCTPQQLFRIESIEMPPANQMGMPSHMERSEPDNVCVTPTQLFQFE